VDGHDARSRSIASIDELVPLRMSTTARSGHVLPACFSSMRLIESPLERRSVVIVERKSKSLVVMTAESCAMAHRADDC
jgi:hypothetical protein